MATQPATPSPPVVELALHCAAKWTPPPQLKVSEFCDAELIVTTGPLAGSHWDSDFAPYQRGILDVFTDEPEIEIAVVMGSSQWGKTSMAVALVAYHVGHDPCPILIVEPTVDPMAKDFSKNRLEPIINASPLLRETVAKKRAKDSSNTQLSKSYGGGQSLSIGGANSAASLAARSVRVLVLDEIERYPPELKGEGDTISIALKRTTAYRRLRRVIMLSSPAMVGGPIDDWHKRGDQRKYWVPCPKCDEFQTYEWKNVRWTKRDPATARLVCPHCSHKIDDAERVAVLGRGEWRADNPDRSDLSIASFHIWEAYSPFSSLKDIVATFLKARDKQKKGDPREMHTWQNTTLGEPWEPDEGEGVESHVLVARREVFPAPVPAGASVLTMGVDTQDDRLELLVLGWGPGEECWIVDRHTISGDPQHAEVWDELDELLAHEWPHELGSALPIRGTCIDSAGHRTDHVYEFVSRRGARRVFATIGRDGDRPIVSSPRPRKWGRKKRKVPLYTIGVDSAKSLLASRLQLTEAGPGAVHIPLEDWADEEMAEQLTSERLHTVWSSGVPSQRWKKRRPRNEALDCWVLAQAALRLVHPNLEQLAELLRRPKPKQPPEVKAPTSGRWLGRKGRGGGRGGGWLKGR